MSREDEAYKSLRRRLNKENNTKHAYKAQTGNRTEQYIRENPLGGGAYQTRASNAETAAFDDTRRDLYKKYGPPRTPTINPFDGMSYRTPGAQALWELSEQMRGKRQAQSLGQFGKGNIDLYNRPKYRQPDGSLSTVNSISFGDESGKEILVPTIGRDAKGRPIQLTDEQAIDQYYKTGQHLGKFDSVEDANRYARQLHNQQEAYYNNGLGFSSLHQIGGLPGAVQQKRVEEYKAAQAAPGGMGSFDDMAAAITTDREKREKAAKDALDMRPSYMKQQGQTPVPQDQLKAEDFRDADVYGSNMEGSRNTTKPYSEYFKDIKTGREDADKFAAGVEKGRQDTRNGLDISDAEQMQSALGGGQRVGAQETTAMLTDQEKQNYYYIAGTQGKNDAENYRQHVIQRRGLNEQIAKRNQEAIAREMSYQTPTDRFLFESGTQFLLGAGGALENMSRVPAALSGDTSYRAESTGQYLSQEMANAVDTSTLSGKAYKTWQQLMNTSGNNAVSIAGGVAFGPGVGSALFAAQAAGDAYQQVINQGGTVQQAQYFAAMQAIDEEVTNALLGGIAARGGGLLKDALGNTAVARTLQSAMKGMFVNNPVGLRIANGVLDALANGGSEALQEYTQYFSEKFEKWLATGEAPTFNVDGKEMTWDQIVEAKGSAAWDVFANPEALESALMGFLNAGLMNGIGSVGRTADAFQQGRNLSQDSYQTVLDMVDPNITHYRKEDTYRAGKEAVELARDQQRRVEAGQGNTLMSQYGRGLMAQAAQEYQRQFANNETAGRTYYNPDNVKALIEENDRKNRALRRLAFGGETAVDKLERIRSELAGDTAQAAWETPQNDHGVREVTIPAEMHEQYTQDMLNRGSADRLEWEGDSGEMVSLQREDDGYYTFTNERGETITLDPDEAIDLLPSGQPITMYDNAGSNAVETAGASATPWGQNSTAAPSTAAQAPSTAAAAQTTAAPTVSQVSPNNAPSNGVAISQQGVGASGTDRLAQLADEAGKQTVEQREEQRNAIYEAGKNRDSGFQSIMDGATMLSEAEKTAAFNQGMQDSLNEVRMEGQNNGRTEEGNLVSGEGSGRDVSLRAGEQTQGVQQTAGGTAETGNGRAVLGEADRGSLGEDPGRVNTGRTGVASGRNRGFRNGEIVQNLERAADKEVRNATADMIEVGEVAPARDLLRTAVPGQTLIPVFGGKTYSLRKTEAMVRAYDKNIMLTPFISSGEIMVGGGESSRAFADPVRRQLGFRLNDEEATGIQLTRHELIEFGIMDGKISVDQAFDILSSEIPQRYIDAIVGEYFSSSTKGMTLTADQTENAFRHAMKEIVCDIGAGIDQISGRIKDEKARRLFEAVHQRANKVLTSYLNERLNNAFKAEPAAETAESSVERVELSKESMTDGVASDGVTMEGEDSIQLSEKLYKESGRDFLRNWLAEQEDISQEDKDDIVAQVDHIYDIMQQIKEEASEEGISGYRAWAEVAERNGRLTVITPNGEYPLNIDFATVCKKRKALDYVLNTMITDGDLDAQKLAGADIVRLQNLIKDEGFEIACALCFVDSKHYRIGKWADSIVNGEAKKDGKKYGYNELVRSLVPEGSKLKIDQFNYTGRDVKQPRGRLLKNASDSQLDFTLIDKVIAENKPGSWNRNLATAIKEHPELRSLLNSAELLSSVGFDPIKVKNPALFDIINNAGGSSKPKLSFSEVPYLNDILMSDAMTPEAAYSVGGVRIQSFSDFMANMVFDYVQMVSELQAKKLPAHAYTKEAAFVAMFGKTGIKINMSLVPKATTWSKAKLDAYLKTFKTKKERDKALAKLKNMAGLDAQGNYIWEDESFPYAVAMKFQADPEYAKNCGTIAVGVSDRHIKKLLMDPTIQMVIPYHKSGINPVVAKLRGIDLYNDYTNQQNTRYKKSGRKISAKANTFDFYGTLQETGDPRATAEAYLAWCKENDFIPKFQKFAKDPETRPYYYKLLADFRLYDDTGAYAPQGAVKGNYPDNMKDLILNGYSFTDKDGTEYHNGGLLDAQKVSDALRAKTREIINRYNSGEKVQNSSKLSSEEVKLPDVESAADDKDNLNVIRQGSDQDIQYSSKLFDKDISDKLKASMATFFSGTGTVDFALRNIVNHEFAVEYDAKIAAVYRANNGDNIYVDDVRNVNINKHKGRVEYFHASPVCKNYSGAKNNAEELPLDLETAQATADAINTLQPKVVTVENVARYRNSEAIKIIEDALRKNGYTFDKGVYRASDFGGATIRERMFLRAVKDGTLPKIDTSEYAPMSWYDAVQDLIPKLPKVSMPNFMAERLEPSGIDINNLKQPIFILGGNKGRTLSYAEADKPAPTILANSHDARIVMPDGRILKATPRVMARIQGLPDAFDLKDGKGGMTNAYRVVGNGVPVQLTQGIVGPLLEENLIKQKSEATGIQYSSKLQGEIDEQYDEALKNNDMDVAAKLVKEAAEKAGYKLSVYHGTGEHFNVFNMGGEGIHLGNRQQAEQVARTRFENRSKTSMYTWEKIRNRVPEMNREQRESLTRAAYFLGDYFEGGADEYPFDGNVMDDTAVTEYVDHMVEAYKKGTGSDNDVTLRMRTFDRETNENVMELYAKINNPMVVNGDIVSWTPSEIADVIYARNAGFDKYDLWYKEDLVDISGSEFNLSENDIKNLEAIRRKNNDEGWSILRDLLARQGYDGIQYKNEYEGDKNSWSYLALSPSDVKSADTITYDDDGNVIPLSERFNPENEDIRYSSALKSPENGNDKYSLNVERSGMNVNYQISDDGKRIAISPESYLNDANWKKVHNALNRLGYGMPSVDITKKYVLGGYNLQPDQSEAVKKILGIASEPKETGVDVGAAKKTASKAARTFGITNDFKKASYLTVNGTMLDFSEGQGYRTLDHRAISRILDLPDDAGYSDGMIEFMNQGNIRLQTYGAEIVQNPNKEQRKVLRRQIESLDGEFTLDVSNEAGYNVFSVDYPEGTRPARVFADIDRYFEDGTIPERNETDMFYPRYSSKLNDPDYAPTFYSKLQREIQNYKGEKIGAASVESYLKGKGVKDEEIKWSGIRQFLESKKSVSKTELMEYLKANELEIEEKVISGGFDTNDEEAYFAAKDALRFDAEKSIDEQGLDVDYNDIEIDEDNPVWEAYYIDKDGNRKVLASVDSKGTRWYDYKLDGGENYREVLFRMPGSDYSNDAMKVHWGEPGVLAHARIQDFESDDGGKVLFIEEIQSDWHNEGQKKGYRASDNKKERDKLTAEREDLNSQMSAIARRANKSAGEILKRIYGNERDGSRWLTRDVIVHGKEFIGQDEDQKQEAEKIWSHLTKEEKELSVRYNALRKQEEALGQEYTKLVMQASGAPDAPFRTTYTDFVLKDLLRMAAEGDYDYLAWTTGKMQEERWSDEFAEGYRIEYDQQVPKFLKKYGKQWGAGLSTIAIGPKTHVEEVKRVFNLIDDETGRVIDSIIRDADNKPSNKDEALDVFRKKGKAAPSVPAIVVNDAMKESVLTEGQPMYSSKNTGEIDEKALDPRRVFISYNPDLQNAVREISDVLTAYQELAPTQAEIKRTTRQIAKKFGSHINVDLAARKMETLYNFLAGGGRPDGREVLEISMDIANDILDEATHNDPEIEKRWKKFKQEMRKRWIYVPKDRVRDLNPDGIKALRKQWKGKMVFTTDEKYRERYGQIHYIELQQMFPEYFTKNADSMNDIEAIEEIMFAFDAQAPVYEQIYTGATRDEAALEIAYDIMQGYFGNDRAKDRFKKIYRDYVKPIKDRAIDEYRDKLRSIELKDAAAVEQRTVFDQIKGMKGSYVVNEKALKDVDYQGRQAMMERLREKAEQDKKRYEEQIEKVKAGYVERSQKDRLMRLAKELRAMKGGPEFEAKKKELIGDLDLIAKGISYNYERKLMDMKEEYERLAEEDENFEPDRATIKKIERLQKKQINQMTAYEITALTEAILKMKQDQWTHNRMIRETDAALIADEGRKIVNETNALKGTKGMNRLADAIDGYSLAHLNSKRAFRKMSGYNDKSGLMKLWNELNEGQHKTMDFRRRAVSPFDAFMSEEENKDFITGMFDPTVEITSSKIEIEDENGNIVRTHEPQTVKITPAMKISIYLHSLNQDNREHARYGGFRIPNMDKYERGDYSNAYGQGSKIVRLTKADMQNIASTMTPQELRFADLAHEYFNKTSKEAINEASMLLNGYELASVDNYMPIKTDPNFTKKDISGLIQDGTIEGQGWTKDRNFMAKNPILLEDITQALQRSIDGAALYYGLAIPVRNFNKVYEFQRSGYTDSVKEAIMQTFGKRGNEYIEKLLRDLQGGNMDTKDAAGKWVDRFTSGLRGNYAQAILTLNPSVAIKQAASYPTAAARLGFEPLKKALAKLTTSTKEDMDLINKYTPLLWYRAQGQSSDALAEVSKRKEAWQYKGGVEKTRQMFNWIQNIDVKTVKTLWYASEYYVQDNMPSFKEGTEAYYREVAKVFNEVVEDTQPNYTTMQRASISRVDNEIMKAVFMFKTQPLQNVGILYDSIMEYQAKQEAFKQAVKNGFEGDALNEYAADMAFARQGMMRSVASITVSTLVFSAMTQLAKLLLHRVDPMRDEETAELTKASILKNFFGNAAESVAGMLAGAGEIYSLIMAMTTGSYLDNLSVSGIDSLNDTMTKMLKTYQNIGKIWEDEEATPRQKTAASIVASRDLTIQIMDLTGIPANNAKKIAEALINHYHDVINPIFTGRPIDTNLESGARITDKQYANRALKYYQRNDIAKGDKAAAKIEKASAMQSVLGAKGKKDEKGNSISNSKKYDAIHRILRTPGSDEAHGKMFAAAYPSDELARYMYGGGSAFDFMQGQMLAEEIADLSEDERRKKLYSFVEETGYTLEQKKAWLVSDKDRIESKTLTAWRDANGTDWDYIKHMSNLEKFNESKNKKEKVVAYIKRQTTDTEKRKALFLMAGYQLDSKEDGKTVKDGNFKKAMEN